MLFRSILSWDFLVFDIEVESDGAVLDLRVKSSGYLLTLAIS